MPPATAIPTRPAEVNPPANRSYGQVVKSSALIGGSNVINVVLSMVRNKTMALWLGTDGVGLFGLYNSVYDVIRSLAGLGINTSGVRQIAEAVGSQDSQRVARTVATLRKVAFATGALGGLLLFLFREPVSWLTFGDYAHTAPLALLALAVFFADVSAGQAALLQGMRRIADLARLNVLGAFFGTALSIPIIYFWRQDGIVPSLVVVAAMNILTSWWYARKVKVERVSMTFQELVSETSALLKLGFVFMASALMTMGMAYLVRTILSHRLDFHAAGFYQAAWALGGQYLQLHPPGDADGLLSPSNCSCSGESGMQPSCERASRNRHASGRSGRPWYPHLRAAGYRVVLLSEIWAGGRDPSLALLRHDAARHLLAYGLHSRRQR